MIHPWDEDSLLPEQSQVLLSKKLGEPAVGWVVKGVQ